MVMIGSVTKVHRARITSQGQITVPKAVRDQLGVRPGDELEFESRGEEVVVRHRRRPSILDFAGIGADAVTRVPATAGELDVIVAEEWTRAASEKLSRIERQARRRR